MGELLRQRLLMVTLCVLAAASVFNATWPAETRLARFEATRSAGLAAGEAPDRGETLLIMDDERVRGVLAIEITDTPQRGPDGWTLEGRMLSLDGKPPVAGAVVLRLFVPNEFSPAHSARALQAPALPGDRVLVFARLSRYSKRLFPRLRAARERMAARGVDARALALEAVEVQTPQARGDHLLPAPVRHPNRSLRRALARARAHFEGRLLRGLSAGRPSPDQHAALALALTTANRSFLVPETTAPFIRTATSHLLAISGLHLGVLAAIIWWLCGVFVNRSPWLLRRFGRRRVCGAAVIAILGCYVLLIGAPVSAVRAWVTLSVGVTAILMLRPLCPFHALSCAALGLVIWEPAVIVDLGFQLSFAATLGILLFLRFRPAVLNPANQLLAEPEPKRGFFTPTRWRAVGLFVGVSTSATLSTLPILAAHLGEVALCGLLVNLVVTPFVSAIVFPALLVGALSSFVFEGLGFAVVWVSTEILLSLQPGMNAVAGLPGAVWVTGCAPLWVILAMGLGALVWVTSGWRAYRVGVGVLAIMLGLSSGLIARPAEKYGELRVHFIPVGQGDAILVEFPDGATLLIDAGGSTLGRDPGRFIVAPYLRRLGIWRLDAVLATHADTDHIGGLPAVIEVMRPRHLIVGGLAAADKGVVQSAQKDPAPIGQVNDFSRKFAPNRDQKIHKKVIKIRADKTASSRAHDPAIRALIAGARRAGTAVHILGGKADRNLGGARFEVVRPRLEEPGLSPSKNETSLVTRLTYKGVSILLTGDIENAGEAWVSAHLPGRITLLKAAHHGSKTSSTPAFLEAVDPQFVVISAGQFNRFGHPHPRVVARYRRRGAKILQTAFHGLIRADIQPSAQLRVQTVQ